MSKTLLLCAVTATAMIPEQAFASESKFDLVCSGTDTSNFSGDPAKTKPFSMRISVDLDQRLYALPFYKAPKPIFEIQTGKLVFERERGLISMQDFIVSRTTGDFSWVNQLVVVGKVTKAEKIGTCQKAEFTKLPSTLF